MIIELSQIRKAFGNRVALENITLELAGSAGSVLAVTGVNGSGKTTLIRLIMGLIAPDRGHISFSSTSTLYGTHRADWRRHIGYMPQQPYALWHLTAWEALYFTGILRGLNGVASRRESDRLLWELNLQDYRHAPLRGLSGGNRAAVSFGTALIGNPEVLLLDEPTASLDPIRREMFWKLLRSGADEVAPLVILVTHSMADVETQADHLVVLHMGHLVFDGSPAQFRSQFSPEAVIEFEALRPIPDGVRTRFNLVSTEGRQTIRVPREQIPAALTDLEHGLGLAHCANLRIDTDSLDHVFVRAFQA